MSFLGSPQTPAQFSVLQNGIQISGSDITDGADNVIYDQSNNFFPQVRLENDSITFSDGDGIQPLSSAALGGSITIDVEANDLTGTFLSEDGSNNLQVNIGRGIINDPNNAGSLAFDESLLYSFTSNITFQGGIEMAGQLDVNNNTITNLPSPVNDSDAAPKSFVEGIAQGLDVKDSTVAASTGNVDLASSTDPRPIDGVSVEDGDRVLLKSQTDATENGIYDANTAADPSTWTRSADLDNDTEASSGVFTFVRKGTENANTSFTISTPDPITLDTTSITWSQFASAGEITGAFGLSKSGQALSVNLSDFIDAEDGLEVSQDNDIIIHSDSSLAIDGSGQVGIEESNTNNFSVVQNFTGGLDVGADISSGSTTIYDSSADEIPDSVMGLIDNSTLANSSISINAGGGISNGGTVSLGGSVGIDIDPSDFINTSQLSINNGNIQIDDIFLSNTGDRVNGSFTFGDFADLEPISEPGAPSSTNTRLFVDSADNNLKAKSDDGTVVTIVST